MLTRFFSNSAGRRKKEESPREKRKGRKERKKFWKNFLRVIFWFNVIRVIYGIRIRSETKARRLWERKRRVSIRVEERKYWRE